MKPKIIVWGGFWEVRCEQLQLQELNSHASVTCHFLTEALSEYFEVVQIPGFYSLHIALQHIDAVAILSCFQAGWTRLRAKDPTTFSCLQSSFSGKLASIIDFVSLQRYAESHLFTVLPKKRSLLQLAKHMYCGSRVTEMGWHAAPEFCRPTPALGSRPFTIFLDHGNYAGVDHSRTIVEAASKVADKSVFDVRILAQTNDGILSVLSNESICNNRYRREAKVRWIDLQSAYSEVDLFCVTHRESAGLGVIEAAMSGAHILVPKTRGQPFVSKDLLRNGVDYTIVECTEHNLERAMLNIMEAGVDRKANHERLARSHSWAKGAEAIAAVLIGGRN